MLCLKRKEKQIHERKEIRKKWKGRSLGKEVMKVSKKIEEYIGIMEVKEVGDVINESR